ncbi:MAG: efflux RND transporter periplasmic adaptor subunit [Thermobispora bispora]|nr:efflux RND transporter periplasmic adaptor subunit [Thermobispora bispora]
MRPSISIRAGGLTLAAAVAVSTAALYAGPAGSPADDRVSLASVTRGTVSAYVSAAGTTVDNGIYDLGFGAEGTVEKIYVKVGDRVKRGDVLARIDDTIARGEYEAAKAALAAAEETLLEQVTSGASGSTASARAATAGAGSTGTIRTAGNGRSGSSGSSACTPTATPQPSPTGGASDAGASSGGSSTPREDGVDSPAARTTGGSGGLRAAGVSLVAYATEQPGSGGADAETQRKTRKTKETRRGKKASPAPTPTPTASPSPSPTPTASPSSTASAAPAPTRTPQAEVTVVPAPASPSAATSPAVPQPSPSASCAPQDQGRDSGDGTTRRGGDQGGDTGGGSAGRPGGGAGGGSGNGTGGGMGSDRAALTEAQAEAQVTQAESALAKAKEALAGVTIKAPADGTVLSIAGTVGTRYTSGTFLTLGDLDDLQVKAMFTESDIRFLKVGQQAEITFPTHPGTTYSGTVAHIDPTATTSDRLVRYGVTIALDDRPDGLLLGQTATVRVTTAEAENALYLPSEAVRNVTGDKAQVTVVNGERRATRTVVIGVRGDRYVQIVSGLAEGERVVLPEGTTSGGFPDEGFPGAS